MNEASWRLPSFVVIGAAKAATTWIVHQLQQHPGVFVPGPEPHYFSSEYHRGDDWYRAWFADATPRQLVGEKSADYLAHSEAAGRMAKLLPDAQIVVQLRNPVERAYSDYCMLFRRGTVGPNPAEYLRPGAERPRFVEDGLYHRHLQRYLDLFPREQFEILLHEDIRRTPEAVIEQVCRHIGVAPAIAPAEVAARVNDGEAPMLPLPMRRVLAPAKGLVAPLRQASWFKRLHASMARVPPYPPLNDGLRERLRDFYVRDVEQLGSLLGRDLSHWLALKPRPA